MLLYPIKYKKMLLRIKNLFLVQALLSLKCLSRELGAFRIHFIVQLSSCYHKASMAFTKIMDKILKIILHLVP